MGHPIGQILPLVEGSHRRRSASQFLTEIHTGGGTKLPVFFSEFLVQNFESFWSFQKSLWWPKKPWNGPKWFLQLSVIDLSPFPDLLKHCSHYILKKYQFSYIVKIIDFWNFNFARLSWPTEALFEQFRNFPHPTTCWWGVENYETFQKVAQLAMKNE